MATTNQSSGTNIHEIAAGIFRINTPIPPSMAPGGFSFNQYLVLDDEPLLFHTGSRRLFPLVVEAIKKVMPIDHLRYVGFSHYEQDECGSLNEMLSVAPRSIPLCGTINALINSEGFDRPAKVMRHRETVATGKRTFHWLDTPHLPHAWECGYLFEETTKTLFCGDLFTQPGVGNTPITAEDILGPSLALQHNLDYWAHSKNTGEMLEMLASLNPRILACMHGSAWQGDGLKLLHELNRSL